MTAGESYQNELQNEINKLEVQINAEQNEIRNQKSINSDLSQQIMTVKDMNEYYMSSYQHLEEVSKK